jgi:hypothetical protein
VDAGGGPQFGVGVSPAIKVTVVPYGPEVGDALSVVVVEASGIDPLTVKLTAEEFDAIFPLSLPYLATTDCAPGRSVFKAKVQEPFDKVQVPSTLAGLLLPTKVTVPVGRLPVTVAVNVTLAP